MTPDPALNGTLFDRQAWARTPAGAARAEAGYAEAEPDMERVKAQLEERALHGLRADSEISEQLAAATMPVNAAWISPDRVPDVLAAMRAARAAATEVAVVVTGPDGVAHASAPDAESMASLMAMRRQQADRLGPLSGTVQ
jgi:hypothetical protein